MSEKPVEIELLEQIQYLKQMLAETNEEKSIQVAIIREEVTEKQQVIDLLTRQKSEIEVELQVIREDRVNSLAELQVLRAEKAASEKELQVMRGERAEADVELQVLRGELDRRGAGVKRSKEAEATLVQREAELHCREADEAVAAVATAGRAVVRERKLREEAQVEASPAHLVLEEMLTRLTDRRVEARVAAVASRALQNGAPCKICYDRAACCVLLPCKHHALCAPCGDRVWRGSDPTCPTCKVTVTGVTDAFRGEQKDGGVPP